MLKSRDNLTIWNTQQILKIYIMIICSYGNIWIVAIVKKISVLKNPLYIYFSPFFVMKEFRKKWFTTCCFVAPSNLLVHNGCKKHFEVALHSAIDKIITIKNVPGLNGFISKKLNNYYIKEKNHWDPCPRFFSWLLFFL